MAAERVGVVGRLEERLLAEARLHALRQRHRDVGERRDLGERLAFAGAPLTVDLAVLEDEVVLAAPRAAPPANFAIFVLHLGAGHVQRRAADRLRAAAERADALLHDRRVAVKDRDVLDRHAELIGEHLRERRLVALAVRRRAGRRGDAAVALDRHLRVLPAAGRQRRRRPDAADLDVHRQAEADEPSLVPCAASRSPSASPSSAP